MRFEHIFRKRLSLFLVYIEFYVISSFTTTVVHRHSLNISKALLLKIQQRFNISLCTWPRDGLVIQCINQKT